MLDWTIGHCRIRLHFLFLASFGVVLFTDLRSSALWGIFAAAVHECGHLLLMRLCGIPAASVEISAFGVLITEQSGRTKCCRQEVLVALGGPMANGTVVLASLLLIRWNGEEFHPLLSSNAALGLFNLLPVESLDGGRALACILSEFLTPGRVHHIVMVASATLLLPAAILGFFLLLRAEHNFSLLAVTVYLIFNLPCKK